MKGLDYIDNFVSYDEEQTLKDIKVFIQNLKDKINKQHDLTLKEQKRLNTAFIEYLLKDSQN